MDTSFSGSRSSWPPRRRFLVSSAQARVPITHALSTRGQPTKGWHVFNRPFRDDQLWSSSFPRTEVPTCVRWATHDTHVWPQHVCKSACFYQILNSEYDSGSTHTSACGRIQAQHRLPPACSLLGTWPHTHGFEPQACPLWGSSGTIQVSGYQACACPLWGSSRTIQVSGYQACACPLWGGSGII